MNVLSLPEVSMSEVSLENGAVEKSDSRLWLDQACLTPLRGLEVRSVSLVSFESIRKFSSEFDCKLSFIGKVSGANG